jgi:hypothetical protein
MQPRELITRAAVWLQSAQAEMVSSQTKHLVIPTLTKTAGEQTARLYYSPPHHFRPQK